MNHFSWKVTSAGPLKICILFLALQPKLFLFSCLLKVWQILRLLSRQLKVREHFAILLRLEIFVRGQNVCWFEWMISVYFTKGHRFGILAWHCLVLLQKPVYTSFVESWCRADANEQTIYIHPRVYILYPRVLYTFVPKLASFRRGNLLKILN